MTLDRQAHARELAEQLLADIELSRTEAEPALLKASRLARLISDDESLRWLELELHGYDFTSATRPMLKRMCRLFKNEKGEERAWLQSLGSIEATIRAEQARVQSMKAPSLSGDGLIVALNNAHRQINNATSTIISYSRIRSAVLSEMYTFATRTFNELTFSESQEELFATARHEIDGLLAPNVDKALDKIESIVERLRKGDHEAVSQAMSTCRRLIDSFADAVYPPSSTPVVVDGSPVEVNKSKVLNRIAQHVNSKVASKSRRDRLRVTLRGIYERVSTGVHDDVTTDEARFLFLQTYVVLGEILTLDGVAENVSVPASAE